MASWSGNCLELHARHYRLCADQLEQALAIEKSPALQEYLVKINNLIPQNENPRQN
jgi:hypothetical protein